MTFSVMILSLNPIPDAWFAIALCGFEGQRPALSLGTGLTPYTSLVAVFTNAKNYTRMTAAIRN